MVRIFSMKDVIDLRLSMWILADWLTEYTPTLKIQVGKRTLRNARLYSEDLQMERSTVYIGKAEDFIDGTRGQVICANEHDMMMLKASDINEVLNKILDAFDHFNSWADQINEKIKDTYSLSEMLLESEPVLKRAVCVADASFRILAQSGFENRAVDNLDTESVLKENIMTLDSILAINEDGRIRVNNPHAYTLEITQNGIRCAVRNIFFRGHHRGWLITDKKMGNFTRGETDVQDELGDLVERWLEYHQSQKELVARTGVFHQILEGSCIRSEDGYRRVESLNWRRGDELHVYVIRFISDVSSLSFSLDRKIEQLGAAFAIHYEDNLVLILNSSLTPVVTFNQGFLQFLESADCFCGISPAFHDVFDLKTNYNLAIIAADYGENMQSKIRELESAALSYYFSLITGNDNAEISHPALRILREYDLKHKTQLWRTLDVYLQCERNYIMTSQALNLHRNSLIYRIERIAELTAANLDSYTTRLHIMMAYEIEHHKTVHRTEPL